MDYLLLAGPAALTLIALAVWAKKVLTRRALTEGANLVKAGLVLRLQRVYMHGLDSTDAVLLARAVVAHIFCDPNRDDEAVNYARENTPLIESEAKRLGSDAELCRIITHAVLAEIEAACVSVKRVNLAAVQKFQRVRALGLWPADTEQPARRVFVSAARAFYDRWNAESADQAPPAAPLLSTASMSSSK